MSRIDRRIFCLTGALILGSAIFSARGWLAASESRQCRFPKIFHKDGNNPQGLRLGMSVRGDRSPGSQF